MSRERDDAGRYTESVHTADLLDVFDAVEGPVVTSGDVADRLGCSRETARRRLGDLEKAGRLASRRTAGRVVWWRTDDADVGTDDTDAGPGNGTMTELNPDDEFWTRDPAASGDADVSERIDDVLYDEA